MGTASFRLCSAGLLLFFGQISCVHQECLHWENAFYHKGYCYKIVHETTTWEEAQKTCKGDDPSRRLAELKDADVAREVIRQTILSRSGIYNEFPSLWIGGSKNDDNRMVWDSNKKMIQLPQNFFEDMTLAPRRTLTTNTEDTVGKCLTLHGSHRELSFRPCEEEKPFICEERVDNPCPKFKESARYIDGYCFNIIPMQSDWYSSKRVCESYNAKLAEPSRKFYDFIQTNVFRDYQIRIPVAQGPAVDIIPYEVELSTSFTFMLRSCSPATMIFYEFHIDNKNAGVIKIHKEKNFIAAYQCLKDKIYGKIHECSMGEIMKGARTSSTDKCNLYNHVQVEYNERKRYIDITFDTLTMFRVLIPPEWYYKSLDSAMLSVTEESSAEWIFPGSVKSVYLGATYNNQNDAYVWSSGEVVDLPQNSWHENQPDGQTHLQMYGIRGLLASVNGEVNEASCICQWELPLTSHIIVKPTTKNSLQLEVTTNSDVLVMLNGKILEENGSQVIVEKMTSIVSHGRPFIYDFDQRESEQIILLQSTQEVTVIMYSVVIREFKGFSSLIYPLDVMSTHYIVYPYDYLQSVKIVYVALGEGKTDIKLISEEKKDNNILEQYQHSSFKSSNVNSPMLVCANQSIAVFSIFLWERIDEFVAFPYTPLAALSNNYITMPSSSWTQSDLVTVIAAYANTKINTSDQEMPSVTLLNEGDIENIRLPSTDGTNHIVQGNKPFYLLQSVSADRRRVDIQMTCQTPIIPYSLWKTNYDFTAKSHLMQITGRNGIVIIFPNDEQSSPLLNGKTVKDMTCQDSTAQFKTCSIDITEKGSYNLRLNSGGKFISYMIGSVLMNNPFCHALGTSKDELVKTIDYSCESYRQNLKVPTTTAMTTEPATSTAVATTQPPTTQPPTTTETTTESTTTERTTEIATTTRTTEMITSTMSVNESDIPCKSTSDCYCFEIDPSLINYRTMSKEEIDQLRITTSKVSKYRRKKISAPDDRITAVIAGISGGVMIISLVFIIIVPDAIALIAYLKAMIPPSKNDAIIRVKSLEQPEK